MVGANQIGRRGPVQAWIECLFQRSVLVQVCALWEQATGVKLTHVRGLLWGQLCCATSTHLSTHLGSELDGQMPEATDSPAQAEA